jgi:hypothetical protein
LADLERVVGDLFPDVSGAAGVEGQDIGGGQRMIDHLRVGGDPRLGGGARYGAAAPNRDHLSALIDEARA